MEVPWKSTEVMPLNDGNAVGDILKSLGNQLSVQENRSDSMGVNAKYPLAPLPGAIGDGINDDTTALQALIDYAQNSSKHLFIPSGTFLVTDELTITKELIVEGIGANNQSASGAVIKFRNMNPAKAAIRVISIASSSVGTQIKQIKFLSATQTPNQHAIVLQGKYYTKFSLDWVSFNDFTGYGFFITGDSYGQNLSLTNLSWWHCGGYIGGNLTGGKDGTQSLLVTLAEVRNINGDSGINQISPQSPLINFLGWREVIASTIVTEGKQANKNNGDGVIIAVGGDNWTKIDGFHEEFHIPCNNSIRIYSSPFGTNKSDVLLENCELQTPIRVSAFNTNVQIKNLSHYGAVTIDDVVTIDQTSKASVSIDGLYSENLLTGIDTKNMGRITVNNARPVSSVNTSSVNYEGSKEIFYWDVSKGALTNTKSPYMNISLYAPSIVNSSIVQDEDVGRCVQLISKGNNMPIVNYNITPTRFIIGSQMVLAIMYKIETKATSGLSKCFALHTTGQCEIWSNRNVIGEWTVGFISIPEITSIKAFKIYSNNFVGNDGVLNAPSILKIHKIKAILGKEVPALLPNNSLLRNCIQDMIPTNDYSLVGDKVLFLKPSLTGTLGAICIEAGVPGIWKTFGQLI